MFFKRLNQSLKNGKSARTIEFTDEEQKKFVKGLFLLTTKPVLYVANVDEDVVSDLTLSTMLNKFVNSQRQKMLK